MADGTSGTRVVGIVIGILGALGLIPALGLAFLSIFMFDAPGSTDNQIAWALALGCWAALPVSLATGILGFVAAARRSARLNWIALAMPVALIAYLAVAFAILEQSCNGRFAC